MPSSYPGALDSFTGTTTPTTSTAAEVGGRTHSKRHDDVEDAVEAVQAELGVAPSGAAATVAARLAGMTVAGVTCSQVLTDGSDQTAALAAEIAALPNGGTLLLPAGTIRLDGQVAIPYELDGTGAPIQKALRIVGNGMQATGRGNGIPSTPQGGTVLDMRYRNDDATKARFQSNGFGWLELAYVTFTDNGATPSTNPFFKHTNTTVSVHDVAAIGSPSLSGITCSQDFIVAGGQTIPVSGDFGLSDDSPYQGYGSTYRNIWVNRIRRAITLGAYANGAIISGVTAWQQCGNPTGGCIEAYPGPGAASGIYGLDISGVTVESLYYAYAVQLRNVGRSTISTVGSYDYAASATYQAAIGLHSCSAMSIFPGYDDIDATHPYVATVAGSSTSNWRDMATLWQTSWAANATSLSPLTFSPPAFAWNGLTVRGNGGGTNPSLKFARAADASTGLQVGFTDYGRTWKYVEGVGLNLTIDSGSGGSYLDLKNYGVRCYSHTGTLQVTLGEGGGRVKMANTATPPPTPTAGGVLWVDAGALKYIGSSGTVTTIAPA